MQGLLRFLLLYCALFFIAAVGCSKVTLNSPDDASTTPVGILPNATPSSPPVTSTSISAGATLTGPTIGTGAGITRGQGITLIASIGSTAHALNSIQSMQSSVNIQCIPGNSDIIPNH